MIAARLEPLQVISLVFIVATLITLILEVWWDPKNWLWTVPLGVWMTHGLIYYAVVIANRRFDFPFDISYTDWSAFLRLHGYVTLLWVEACRLYLKYLHRRAQNAKRN